jgi:PAS domain S-box-containing protein
MKHIQPIHEEYEALFQLSTDLIAVAGPGAYFLHLNPAWTEAFGYSLEELMAVPFTTFIHPDDRDITERLIEKAVLDRQEICQFVNRYRSKDGRYRWLSWNARFSKHEAKVYAIARDITDRREAELRWQQREDLQRQLERELTFESGEAFFEKAVLSLQKAILGDYALIGIYNQQRTGIDMQALCCQGKLLEPISYELQHSPCADVLAGNLCSIRFGIAQAYPHDAWLREMQVEGYVGVVLYDHQYQPIGIMAVLYQQAVPDVALAEETMRGFAPRVSLELDRTIKAKALKATQERFAHVFEYANDGILLVCIENGIITECNGRVAEILGYPKATALVGKPVFDLHVPRNRAWAKENFQDIQRRGEKLFEAVLLHQNGSEIPVEVNSRQIILNGKPVIMGFLRDIASRKAYEQRLEDRNQELMQANQALDNFVYCVSHDLRAPISSALGLIDIMRDEPDPQTQQHYLDLMASSLQKQHAFIGDVLDYSRNARMEVGSQEVFWGSMINETLEQLQHLPEQQGLSIEVNVRQTQPFYSDPQRIVLILNNLIANSIRYSNPYQAHPFVNISLESIDRGVRFTIEDNGIGIGQEHQARVFDMFYRATDRKQGSGLGLYIVKEAVQKLGGTLSLSSAVGKGTTFVIDLPSLHLPTA